MWVIVGCGYVGTRLPPPLRPGGAVAAGGGVTVPRRSNNTPPARRGSQTRGDTPAAVSGTRTLVFDDTRDSLEVSGATVAWLAPPREDVSRLAGISRAAARFVYVSSTGVYAPAGGAWVDEDFPLAPATASGRLRLAAE